MWRIERCVKKIRSRFAIISEYRLRNSRVARYFANVWWTWALRAAKPYGGLRWKKIYLDRVFERSCFGTRREDSSRQRTQDLLQTAKIKWLTKRYRFAQDTVAPMRCIIYYPRHENACKHNLAKWIDLSNQLAIVRENVAKKMRMSL